MYHKRYYCTCHPNESRFFYTRMVRLLGQRPNIEHIKQIQLNSKFWQFLTFQWSYKVSPTTTFKFGNYGSVPL